MNRNTISRWMIVAVAALSGASPAVRGQTAPQRSITNPTSTAAPNTADPMDKALRQYRDMWQKMTPAQQKAFVASGGSTPEQYERMLRGKGTASAGGRQTPTAPASAADALDSLTMSLQDLNAIRDGNLGRVQKDGCPPEVASRLADLRVKLHQDETELSGAVAPAPPPPSKDQRPATDPQSLAADWFKRPSQDLPEALGSAAGSPAASQEDKLLAGVLPGASPAAAKSSQTPLPPEQQKAVEEEIARLKIEITQLSGACTALKK